MLHVATVHLFFTYHILLCDLYITFLLIVKGHLLLLVLGYYDDSYEYYFARLVMPMYHISEANLQVELLDHKVDLCPTLVRK